MVELEAMPEAWGEGNRRRHSPTKNRDTCTPLKADDVKFDAVEVHKETEDQETNHSDDSNLFKGIKFNKPVGRSLSCRRKKNNSDSSLSEDSISWTGPMDEDGSGSQSVRSPNIIRAIRNGCRASRKLLTYSEMVFKNMLKKLELMHTNTRMRIQQNLRDDSEKMVKQMTNIEDEVKELRQMVKQQSQLLKQHLQTLRKMTSSSKHTQTLASTRQVTHPHPARKEKSRATYQPIRLSVSHGANAPTNKTSRIPIAVRKTKSRSRVLDKEKPEETSGFRNRSGQSQTVTTSAQGVVFKQQQTSKAGTATSNKDHLKKSKLPQPKISVTKGNKVSKPLEGH